MKRSLHYSFIIFKHISCLLVLIGMLLTPISQTIEAFADSSKELVDSTDETTSDEEKKEEQDNKKQLQILSPSPYPLYQVSSAAGFEFLNPILDYSLEIPIPPPDRA